ncbi:hypothetical protein GCM10010377_10990 [Streptomyces viridiviolaceus]|nr:hypothetical protein GCM10010377_10990 [Streptomyces viridiviolaceus]
MEIGSPVPRSVDVRTSAEPRSSVRSVTRESAAMMVSALSTASAAVLAPSEPHAEVATMAAAVSPTQAAVYLSFIESPPVAVIPVIPLWEGL